ncbi:MAG: hypothetical protein WCK05_00345 [Planctomycetota bacterium]
MGNGPSVDAMPPAFWRGSAGVGGLLLAGTNRVLCLRALRAVPWDLLVIRDTYRNLWHDPGLGARYHEGLWKPHEAYKVGPADRRVTWCDEFVRQEPGWQPAPVPDANREPAVMRNGSVVLMALNWAYWQGVRQFALVGVDYTGGEGPAMIEPYAGQSQGWEGRYDTPVPDVVERQFAEALAGVRAGGGNIMNLSPGSRLQAVPAGDWRTWLEDCRDSGQPAVA